MATAHGLIGLMCELVGLGIALSGLNELNAELFPTSPLPHEAVGRWIKRRLGFKPKPITIHAEPATLTVTAGEARVLTTKGRPSDAAPHSQWTAYWDSRLGNLSDQIDWLREDMKEADNDLGARLKAERVGRHEAIAQLQERLRVVVGGEGGRGLRRTWWGLA
jgi:hypothetical protein